MSRLKELKKKYNNLSEKDLIDLLSIDGELLRFIDNQTEAMCLAAINECSLALEYVHNQTPKILDTVLQQNGMALEYVHNQTPELVIKAIKSSRLAIKFVKDDIFTELFNTLEQIYEKNK